MQYLPLFQKIVVCLFKLFACICLCECDNKAYYVMQMKKYQYEQQHKEEIAITCSSEIPLGKALHYEAEMLD